MPGAEGPFGVPGAEEPLGVPGADVVFGVPGVAGGVLVGLAASSPSTSIFS